jgi:hypothetical protein
MPFVNQKQRAACYAKAREANKKGKKPAWDCKKWELKGGRRGVSSLTRTFSGIPGF